MTHGFVNGSLLCKRYTADCSRHTTTSTRPREQARIKGVSPLCESRKLWSCFGWNNNTIECTYRLLLFWHAPLGVRSTKGGRFWAMSIASFRERLLDFRSCWIVFVHVLRGRPGGLLQFSKGPAVKIFLATVVCLYNEQTVYLISLEFWAQNFLWTSQEDLLS